MTSGKYLALLLAVASGCGPAPPASSAPDPSGHRAPPDPLLDTREIQGDFLWRQRLHASYGEASYQFDAIVEKSSNSLRVLFLTPFGTRALLLEQVGHRVSTRYFVSERLPFPPRHILGDIHRVFFRGFSTSAPRAGVHAQLVAGERFRDTWRAGRLVRRSVTWAGDTQPGAPEQAEISIRYQPGFVPGSPPARVQLDNAWRGYHIDIETLPTE